MFNDDYNNNLTYMYNKTDDIIENVYNYKEIIITYIFYILIIKIIYDLSCQIFVTKININNINITFQDIRHTLKDGDMIFLSSNNKNGHIIKAWDNDIVSHVGIVFIINNQPFIFESEKNYKNYDILSKKIGKDGTHLISLDSKLCNYKSTFGILVPIKKKISFEEYKHVLNNYKNDYMFCTNLVAEFYINAGIFNNKKKSSSYSFKDLRKHNVFQKKIYFTINNKK
jgi:hypothetical protein